MEITIDESTTLFTEKQIIAFGNYLLSKFRKENLVNKTNETCVTDADLTNWLEEIDY